MVFVTGNQGKTFCKKSELIPMQYKTLENSEVYTAADFCSPEAGGMSPTYWNEPVFSRSHMYKMSQWLRENY